MGKMNGTGEKKREPCRLRDSSRSGRSGKRLLPRSMKEGPAQEQRKRGARGASRVRERGGSATPHGTRIPSSWGKASKGHKGENFFPREKKKAGRPSAPPATLTVLGLGSQKTGAPSAGPPGRPAPKEEADGNKGRSARRRGPKTKGKKKTAGRSDPSATQKGGKGRQRKSKRNRARPSEYK